MSPFQIFLSKFYEAVIIALTAFLLLVVIGFGIQSWRVIHYKSEYNELIAKYDLDVAQAEAATAEAEANAARKEKIWSEKILEVEQNATQKIKAAADDARSADLAADSLSKQLDKAKKRVSTATEKTIYEYIDTSSNVLKHCVAEYRSLAKAADAERIDKERLIEAWPE